MQFCPCEQHYKTIYAKKGVRTKLNTKMTILIHFGNKFYCSNIFYINSFTICPSITQIFLDIYKK